MIVVIVIIVIVVVIVVVEAVMIAVVPVAEVVAIAAVAVFVEDGYGKAHALAAHRRFGAQGAAATVLVREHDDVRLPALLLHGHLQLELALFFLILDDGALRPARARAVVVDIDVPLLRLRLALFGLVRAFLLHADIGGARLVEVGGKLRLALRLALAAVVFALRLAPPFHGVGDAVFGHQHPLDRVVFLRLVPVNVRAQRRHVVVEVAADADSEQVGVPYGRVVGVLRVLAARGRRLVLDRPLAEQLLDERHVPVDGLGDRLLFLRQTARNRLRRREQFARIYGGRGEGSAAHGGHALQRRRTLRLRARRGRGLPAAFARRQDRTDGRRPVGVKVVRALDV